MTAPAPVTFTMPTRYGLEEHHHVNGATHVAGPGCPCGPTMKAHATVKAAGPAHTARHLEQLAQLLIGPRWRDFAQEAADA